MRFWVSWVEENADHRPLMYPPNSAVAGWWCSGRSADDLAVICAVVDADDERAAELAVLTDWPLAGGQHVRDWRFFESKENDFKPSEDRFPPSEWMARRLEGKIA
jgi:hypothetical protein